MKNSKQLLMGAMAQMSLLGTSALKSAKQLFSFGRAAEEMNQSLNLGMGKTPYQYPHSKHNSGFKQNRRKQLAASARKKARR